MSDASDDGDPWALPTPVYVVEGEYMTPNGEILPTDDDGDPVLPDDGDAVVLPSSNGPNTLPPRAKRAKRNTRDGDTA